MLCCIAGGLAVAAIGLWTRFRTIAIGAISLAAFVSIFAVAAHAFGGRAERAGEGAPPVFLARSICGLER